MAKKKKKIKQVIRAAGPVISNKEMKKIVKAAGGNTQTAINRIASVQQNFKAADKPAPVVASGAANMLIKQAEKASPFNQPSFGTSKLGQTLQSMVPTQGISGYIKGEKTTFLEGSPGFNPGGNPTKNRMIGGTVIRPGGNIAVRPMSIAAAPAAPTPTLDGGGAPNTGGTPNTGDTGFNMDDFMAQISDMLTPEMPEMEPFENVSSDFETRDPLQLAALGQSYGGDMIRARQRRRRGRGDYRRGMSMMPGVLSSSNLAPMMIGGGLTL